MQQLEKIADHFHGAGVDRVFVTRGSDGVFYSGGDERGSMASRADETAIENTTGAGDAFLAGLVSAHLDKRSLEDSVRFALGQAQEQLS